MKFCSIFVVIILTLAVPCLAETSVKEKGKEIIATLKESKIKVQAQIQDEQVIKAAKGRTAVISLERNAAKQLVVGKVTFVKTAN